jgi:hypothetical protein
VYIITGSNVYLEDLEDDGRIIQKYRFARIRFERGRGLD